MSQLKTIIDRLDRYVYDNGIPNDVVGSKIIGDVMQDSDYDSLSLEYPEINEIAERASDMEYESEQYAFQGRKRIIKLLEILKNRVQYNDEIINTNLK